MNFIKIALTCFFLFLTACTPQRENMKIKMSIFQKKNTILVTQVGEFPKPQYIKNGKKDFLLDSLMNEVISSDVHNALNTCNITSIIDSYYFQEFETTFKKKKVKFIINKNPLQVKNFAKIDDELIYLAPYDFSSLKNKYEADYVLVLEPIRYYLEREYCGFIPLSAPRGISYYRMYLVNLKNNELEGYYSSISHEDINGWIGHDADEIVMHLKDVVKKHLLNGHDYLVKF